MAWPSGSFGEYWDLPEGTDTINGTWEASATTDSDRVLSFRVTVGIDPELTLEEAQDTALQGATEAAQKAAGLGRIVKVVAVDRDPESVHQ